MMRADRDRLLADIEALRQARPGDVIRIVQLAIDQWVLDDPSCRGAVVDLRSTLDRLVLTSLLTVPDIEVRRLFLYDLPSDLAGMLTPGRTLEDAYATVSGGHRAWKQSLMAQMAAVGLRRTAGVPVLGYDIREVILGRAEVGEQPELDAQPEDRVLVGDSEDAARFDAIWDTASRTYSRVSPIDRVPAGDAWPPAAIG